MDDRRLDWADWLCVAALSAVMVYALALTAPLVVGMLS